MNPSLAWPFVGSLHSDRSTPIVSASTNKTYFAVFTSIVETCCTSLFGHRLHTKGQVSVHAPTSDGPCQISSHATRKAHTPYCAWNPPKALALPSRFAPSPHPSPPPAAQVARHAVVTHRQTLHDECAVSRPAGRPVGMYGVGMCDMVK